MDEAKDIARYVEGLRREKQAQKNAQQLFAKEAQRIKLSLELKFSTFYDQVEGYAKPGDFLEQYKQDNKYVFGETEVSLFFKTPENSKEYLKAILDVNYGEAYVFNVAYNGTNFYWEYKNNELTEAKIAELMSKIILES